MPENGRAETLFVPPRRQAEEEHGERVDFLFCEMDPTFLTFHGHPGCQSTSGSSTRPFFRELTVFLVFQCAHGSGFFELQVLEMVNPRGELSNEECCGGGARSPVTGRCSTPCNTFFRLCLKEYQSNVTSTGSCSFGNTSSVALGRDSFTLADPERGKLVLPFTFRWTVSTLTWPSRLMWSGPLLARPRRIGAEFFGLFGKPPW
ncbi:MNNL domain containing protein [Asbolus verrucosus]|uniref:MNNL domain containing protein n=1 Tax=Asbolus verrucosus TaxID=1661398 RepID=A0A482WDE4_ASBVE|nr:MNNL domain containing protein [Asbolus verrucosus]